MISYQCNGGVDVSTELFSEIGVQEATEVPG